MEEGIRWYAGQSSKTVKRAKERELKTQESGTCTAIFKTKSIIENSNLLKKKDKYNIIKCHKLFYG
jgi:hypothetical protein